MKKKKGRPRKRHGRKTERLTIRLSPEDKRRYESASMAANAEDTTAWVRSVLDAEARRVLGET